MLSNTFAVDVLRIVHDWFLSRQAQGLWAWLILDDAIDDFGSGYNSQQPTCGGVVRLSDGSIKLSNIIHAAMHGWLPRCGGSLGPVQSELRTGASDLRFVVLFWVNFGLLWSFQLLGSSHPLLVSCAAKDGYTTCVGQQITTKTPSSW